MPTYTNNGDTVQTTVVVDKKVNGVSEAGYPKNYSVLIEFTDPSNGDFYPALTEFQFSILSEQEILDRLAAFKNYILDQEPGMTMSDLPAWNEVSFDDSACPTSETVETTEFTLIGCQEGGTFNVEIPNDVVTDAGIVTGSYFYMGVYPIGTAQKYKEDCFEVTAGNTGSNDTYSVVVNPNNEPTPLSKYPDCAECNTDNS